jgi:hypothetical protein
MVMRERLNWGGVAFLVIMGGSAALFVSGCATGMEAVTGPPKPAPAPIVANVVQCPTVHAFTPERRPGRRPGRHFRPRQGRGAGSG